MNALITFTSSHFPLYVSGAFRTFHTFNNLEETSEGVDDESCHFQTEFKQSRAVLMINLIYPPHTHKHTHSAQVENVFVKCVFLEISLRLNSPLTALTSLCLFLVRVEEH
ncbi:Hypothetical predicted protein [Xyrichtys novacula]|uniref:Uncharacterized protein n=1 Tax=Xyrichtys novacula TaxID=13765 RepID=A0AAV1FYP6_XYRNO|nr:Hypothetical predicted protein [Xyrichtys novacula]